MNCNSFSYQKNEWNAKENSGWYSSIYTWHYFNFSELYEFESIILHLMQTQQPPHYTAKKSIQSQKNKLFLWLQVTKQMHSTKCCDYLK